MFRSLPLLVLAASVAHAQTQCTAPTPEETHDALSDTRVLRRVYLALTGVTPPVSKYEALLATPAAGRQAALDAEVEALLASNAFYEQMLRFGQEWLAVPAYTKGAQGDAYQGDMSGHLFTCASSTAHPGALYGVGENGSPGDQCSDANAEQHSVEPWWAPGTTVTVLGKAGGPTTTVTDAQGHPVDCGVAHGGYYDPALPAGCGCGPNLVWCAPLVGLNSGSNYDLFRAQRRHPFEEPARLFAHLAWHDRALTDLVVGNTSVGTNWLRALYVRQGRQQGAGDVANTWWKAGADAAPRDPLHPGNDPQAWREFTVEDLNPYFLARREYQFDPRQTTAAPEGLPAAGVLTMLGTLSAYPRERVRAARLLEMFACSSFNPPPAGVSFPDYVNDPATGGTCMHCHRVLDPAAIFFKRWDFAPSDSYYVPWPFLAGVGRFRVTPAWVSGQYPHSAADNDPGFRWRNAFVPGTVMTPVTPAQAATNAEALLLDTMPQDYTLLGAHGDGTMGPLGFGKILVSSGAFDRCAVRKIYARIVGRELDATAESGYLEVLTARFVADDRRLRPFIRYLLTQPEFRRGL